MTETYLGLAFCPKHPPDHPHIHPRSFGILMIARVHSSRFSDRVIIPMIRIGWAGDSSPPSTTFQCPAKHLCRTIASTQSAIYEVTGHLIVLSYSHCEWWPQVRAFEIERSCRGKHPTSPFVQPSSTCSLPFVQPIAISPTPS